MKKLIAALILSITAIAHAQFTPPAYLLVDASGNPYPSGGGTPLGYTPQAMTCYTIVSGSAVPCTFSGGGGGSITLTTIGTSGAATLTGTVLNIPVYSSGGGTTTNALTGNNSGTGAASGSTFNGSAATTFSYNTFGAYGLAASNNTTGTTQTFSTVPTASTPVMTFTGGIFAGTGTTSVPAVYFNYATTQPTTFSTGGVAMGVNAASSAGNFFELHQNGGTTIASISNNGKIYGASGVQGGFFQTLVTTLTGTTPAISATNGLQTITLSGPTTPTITGITSGLRITFQICQPASGGPYTWTWPASIHGGMTIGTTASTCSMQSFDSFSGTTLLPESTGVINIAP